MKAAHSIFNCLDSMKAADSIFNSENSIKAADSIFISADLKASDSIFNCLDSRKAADSLQIKVFITYIKYKSTAQNKYDFLGSSLNLQLFKSFCSVRLKPVWECWGPAALNFLIIYKPNHPMFYVNFQSVHTIFCL